jgi:hypothetical protein
MSAFIGDLMAVADEGYGDGGGKKKRGKRASGRTKAKTAGCDGDEGQEFRDNASGGAGAPSKSIGPSARTERGPQDDNSVKKVGKKKVSAEADGGVVGAGFFTEGAGDGDDCVEAGETVIGMTLWWTRAGSYGECWCGRRRRGWGRGGMRCMRRCMWDGRLWG